MFHEYIQLQNNRGALLPRMGCREKPAATFLFHNLAARSLLGCGQGTESFRSTHPRWWDDLALQPGRYHPVPPL